MSNIDNKIEQLAEKWAQIPNMELLMEIVKEQQEAIVDLRNEVKALWQEYGRIKPESKYDQYY